MPASSYIHELRQKIGHKRLLIPSVAAIIRDDENRLLLQQKSGTEGWSLPAGAIEPTETPEEALHREVLEETGFTVSSTRLIGAFGGRDFRYTYPNGDQVEYTVLVYRCTVLPEPVEICDAETVRVDYFSRETAPPLALPYPKSILFGRT